jgi:hypothetical protein
MNRILSITTICFFLLVILTLQIASAEQKCKEAIIASCPDSNFILQNNGTAIHKTTGLMWMRCVLGQQWDGLSCKGTAASFSWGEALNAAVMNKFSDFSDWRLPNKNELESIVEVRCVSPSINAGVFPSTPQTFHWTSTPYAGVSTGAWSVDFGFGVVTATDKSGKIVVRLVRDTE